MCPLKLADVLSAPFPFIYGKLLTVQSQVSLKDLKVENNAFSWHFSCIETFVAYAQN